MQDCPKNFYRRDCDDGLGPVCIMDGLGCSNECPPGLVRDTQGGGGKPPSYGCIFKIQNLTNYQKLSSLGVDKSDYYRLGGTFDDAAYTAALVAAYNTTENTWKQLMVAIHLTTPNDQCKAQNAFWRGNSRATYFSGENSVYSALKQCEAKGINTGQWGFLK